MTDEILPRSSSSSSSSYQDDNQSSQLEEIRALHTDKLSSSRNHQTRNKPSDNNNNNTNKNSVTVAAINKQLQSRVEYKLSIGDIIMELNKLIISMKLPQTERNNLIKSVDLLYTSTYTSQIDFFKILDLKSSQVNDAASKHEIEFEKKKIEEKNFMIFMHKCIIELTQAMDRKNNIQPYVNRTKKKNSNGDSDPDEPDPTNFVGKNRNACETQ